MNKSIFKYLLLIMVVITSLVGCANNTQTAKDTTITQNPTTTITTNNVTTLSEHEYGYMYYAKDATFLEEGNIAYYQCSHCNKFFDENFVEVESVVIPKLSNEISLYINGEYNSDFELVEEEENHISWKLNANNLKKDDVVTIRSKNDSTKTFNFFAGDSSLIDMNGIVHNDANESLIEITFTPNGMQLSSTGFEYNGITIIVSKNDNTIEKEMNKIVYDFGEETESYI